MKPSTRVFLAFAALQVVTYAGLQLVATARLSSAARAEASTQLETAARLTVALLGDRPFEGLHGEDGIPVTFRVELRRDPAVAAGEVAPLGEIEIDLV